MKKKALITGITGQDGSYLSELLLDKGYDVYGMVRRASVERFDRIAHIQDRLNLIQGDLTDQSSLDEAVKTIQPDEVYNLIFQPGLSTAADAHGRGHGHRHDEASGIGQEDKA